jgi:hypothetical protein
MMLAPAGCGDGTPIASPSAAFLSIEGPSSVDSGTTTIFRALLRNADQSVRDVSQEVQWSTSNPGVLSIDRGLASGLAAGDVTVEARLDDARALKRLAVSPPPVAYTLTIGAGNCSDGAGLPVALRERTYTAVLVQRASTVNVTLDGADFIQGSWNFSGHIEGANVELDFQWYDGENPRVAERLADGSALVFSGRVLAMGTPTGYSGTFKGGIWLKTEIWANAAIAYCFSESHRLTLTRR